MLSIGLVSCGIGFIKVLYRGVISSVTYEAEDGHHKRGHGNK